MKTLKITTISLLLPFFSFGQQVNSDYYQLSKGGEKYLKPVRYVLTNENGKKVQEDNSTMILFIIEEEIFKHFPEKHDADTIDISNLNKDKIKKINQLKKDEYEEHKTRTAQEGINMPPPFNHYNLKVYVLEKLFANKAVKYEVDWIFKIP